MIIKRIGLIICFCLLSLLLGGCLSPAEREEERKAEEARRLEYGRTELSLSVSSEDELSVLENYTSLEKLDLHGSRCYGAIEAYAAAHPQVQIVYSVILGPDEEGTELENTAERVVLPKGTDVAALALRSGSFLQLREIILGDPGFSGEDLAALQQAFPDARIAFLPAEEVGEVSLDAQEVDYTALKPENVGKAAAFLSEMPDVRYVRLTAEGGENLLGFEEVRQLQDARPEALFDYRFDSFGQTVSVADEELEYLWANIYNDGMEQIRAMMPCMDRLRSIYFQYCQIDYDVLAEFREDYPEVDVVWRVDFGPYSCRTDTERIFANGSLTAEMCYNLRYCNRVKYIDMGHNDALSSIDFTAFMPDLEVAIFAGTSIWDLSPLANCSKLWYLEVFVSNVTDVSPLANCTALEHLNLSCLYGLTDISPLYGLTGLKRLWNTCTSVPWVQRQEIMQRLPDCEFCFDYVESTGNHWRYEADGSKNEIYAQIDAIFDYDNFRDNLSWW